MTVSGRVAVLLVNFGEPMELAEAPVLAYLERIFRQNLRLDAAAAADARVRELAARRAPGLLEAYRSIGGSPLNAQADAQAERLAEALGAAGRDARVFSAFQFTEPFVHDAVALARVAGAEALVAIPVYPLCGQSTTVAAIDEVGRALGELGWSPRFAAVAGWHHHPDYLALRAGGVRSFLESRGLDLADPDTLLFFSVHGTPVQYLSEGNRYDRYVEEHCRELAAELAAHRYAVGFQNHENRPIPWTRPTGEEAIRAVPERRLVVVPTSFMHEQSETLVELDRDLSDFAAGLGKELHRVPVPWDDPAFPALLADLVTRSLAAEPTAGGSEVGLSCCRCRPVPGTWCTNGSRDLPPSRFART